jgi:hypothetical protein
MARIEPLSWDVDREPPVPTEAEREFGEALGELLPHHHLSYDCHVDADGEPWMLVAMFFIVSTPGKASVRAATLRLDFDAAGIRGGPSPGNLNWDTGMRAELAKVDLTPPDGISVSAEGHTIRELAAIAAEWFQRHWDEFLPQRGRLEGRDR